MDLQCDLIPIVVGGTMGKSANGLSPLELFAFQIDVSRNIGYVAGRFVNSVDTIDVKGVRKTPLLVNLPTLIIICIDQLNENKNVPEDISLNVMPFRPDYSLKKISSLCTATG